jgi:glucosamine--fructose-6-phosphate aminotransferase (isomerizing)
VEALDLVREGLKGADLLVLVSHEGQTALTLEVAKTYPEVKKWLVTGAAESPLADLCDEVVMATPALERSWCHTASYTCAVAAIAALRGEDVNWLPEAVTKALHDPEPASEHERFLVAGAGRDWPTAQEAALKLREGAFVAAEAHHTEQLLHGHLAAVDDSVRCFVLEGTAGSPSERRMPSRPCGSSAARSLLFRRSTPSWTSFASSS